MIHLILTYFKTRTMKNYKYLLLGLIALMLSCSSSELPNPVGKPSITIEKTINITLDNTTLDVNNNFKLDLEKHFSEHINSSTVMKRSSITSTDFVWGLYEGNTINLRQVDETSTSGYLEIYYESEDTEYTFKTTINFN